MISSTIPIGIGAICWPTTRGSAREPLLDPRGDQEIVGDGRDLLGFLPRAFEGGKVAFECDAFGVFVEDHLKRELPFTCAVAPRAEENPLAGFDVLLNKGLG